MKSMRKESYCLRILPKMERKYWWEVLEPYETMISNYKFGWLPRVNKENHTNFNAMRDKLEFIIVYLIYNISYK